MRIAIFDSGIGGFTVLKKAMEHLPEAEYLYFADTKNVPYGVKQKQEVVNCVLNAFKFLSNKNIHIAVVACNTATSVAIAELRRRFDFPIIGMEPAIKPAIRRNSGRKILLLATSLTLRESKLEELITSLNGAHKIQKHSLDELVSFAENLDFDSENVERYLRIELASIDIEKFEAIVLGCTHFIYYADLFRKIAGKHIAVIDGNEGTVRNLIVKARQRMQYDGNNGAKGGLVFYSTGSEDCSGRVKKLLEISGLADRFETDKIQAVLADGLRSIRFRRSTEIIH